MTNSRISQSGADTLASASAGAPRVTQSGADALTSASAAKPRISQSGADALISASGAKPRITQSGFDVLASFLLAPSVTLFSLCSRQIEIDAVATGHLQFDFYRSANQFTGYTLVGSNDTGVLVDTVPLAFTDYWYTVAVTYVSGLGPPSAPLTAQAKDTLGKMTPPIAVATDSKVVLTWSAFPSATGYSVYRDGVQLATGITALTYTDTTAINDIGYSYAISAINVCGDGPLSEVAIGIPHCCFGDYVPPTDCNSVYAAPSAIMTAYTGSGPCGDH